MNATTNHINTHESRTVRGVRFVFLFGCGYAALGEKDEENAPIGVALLDSEIDRQGETKLVPRLYNWGFTRLVYSVVSTKNCTIAVGA